jgi:hypothetical protein
MQPSVSFAIAAGLGTLAATAAVVTGMIYYGDDYEKEPDTPPIVPPPSGPPRPADEPVEVPGGGGAQSPEEAAEVVLSSRTVQVSENASMPAPVTIEVVSTPKDAKPFETRFRHGSGITRFFHTNRAAADVRAGDLMLLRPMAISCIQEYSDMFDLWRCERDQQLVTGDIAAFGMRDDGTTYRMVRVRVDTERDKPFVGEHQGAGRDAWQPMGSWEHLMQAEGGV